MGVRRGLRGTFQTARSRSRREGRGRARRAPDVALEAAVRQETAGRWWAGRDSKPAAGMVGLMEMVADA